MLLFQVVEAALYSRIQRLEQRLMDLEPRVSKITSDCMFSDHQTKYFIFEYHPTNVTRCPIPVPNIPDKEFLDLYHQLGAWYPYIIVLILCYSISYSNVHCIIFTRSISFYLQPWHQIFIKIVIKKNCVYVAAIYCRIFETHMYT